VRYLSVLEYEDGRRVLRLGKEKVEGSDMFINDDLEDAESLSFYRVVLFRLPEKISKKQAKEDLDHPLTADNIPDWFPKWLLEALESGGDAA